MRAIDIRRIAPWGTRSKDPRDAFGDAPVVHSRHAARIVGQHRADDAPFVVAEVMAHDSKLQLGLEIRVIPTPSTPKERFFHNYLLLGYATNLVQATNGTALSCRASACQVRSTLVSGHAAVKAAGPSRATSCLVRKLPLTLLWA